MDANRHYTSGTQAIDQGRYDEGIMHLTEAIRLDPGSARSHNTLAAAYFASGRVREGWTSVRHAYSLDRLDRHVRANLLRHLGQLIHEGHLKEGTSREVVRDWLGTPDRVDTSGADETWQYGSMGMRFKGDELVGAIQVDRLTRPARGRRCLVCGPGG